MASQERIEENLKKILEILDQSGLSYLANKKFVDILKDVEKVDTKSMIEIIAPIISDTLDVVEKLKEVKPILETLSDKDILSNINDFLRNVLTNSDFLDLITYLSDLTKRYDLSIVMKNVEVIFCVLSQKELVRLFERLSKVKDMLSLVKELNDLLRDFSGIIRKCLST